VVSTVVGLATAAATYRPPGDVVMRVKYTSIACFASGFGDRERRDQPVSQPRHANVVVERAASTSHAAGREEVEWTGDGMSAPVAGAVA
jgi:hypothetical protein